MSDIFAFATHPFTILWTILIVGALVAMPDIWTHRVTSRDNLGAYAVVAGGLVVLLLGGLVNFNAINRTSPIGGVLRYVLHPLTIGWTLIIVGIVIALPDGRTDYLLSQDKFGSYAVLAALIGFAIFSLNLISFQLIAGIVVGGIAGFYASEYRHRTDVAVVDNRSVTPPQESFIPTVAPSELRRFAIPVGDENSDVTMVRLGTEAVTPSEGENFPDEDPQ